MRKMVLAAVGATLVLAACGGGSGDDTGSAAPESAPADSSASDAASGETGGRPVQLANGGTVDLDAFEGQDVLFWFWAPW